MSVPSLSDLAPEYRRLFLSCQPRPAAKAEIAAIIERMLKHRARYESVANKLVSVPWYFIALIHNMESFGLWTTHLHNGDSLRMRTTRVPAGRPKTGTPPFTWEESAWDALHYDKRLHKWQDWSVAGQLYQLERYNGWGYRRPNVTTVSPYLWAGCMHYERGKYVRDGEYDPNAVSKQIGAAVLLHALCQGKHIALLAQEVGR